MGPPVGGKVKGDKRGLVERAVQTVIDRPQLGVGVRELLRGKQNATRRTDSRSTTARQWIREIKSLGVALMLQSVFFYLTPKKAVLRHATVQLTGNSM